MAVTVRYGSKGTDVVALQNKLNSIGFDCGAADGIFGKKTLAAVRLYQAAKGLEVDGIVGPQTWASLDKPSGADEKPHTEHFRFEEFACPDGTPIPVQYYGNLQKLMDKLELLRHAIGDRPIIIRSGYRSPAYNAKVGGASGSQHVFAAAADIYCPNRLPNCYQIALAAKPIFYDSNVGGIGCGANVNLHVDVRGRRAIWWYNYKSWDSWAKNQGPRG